MKVKLTELNSGYRGYGRVSRYSKKTQTKMIIAGVLAGAFLFVYILSSVGIIPIGSVGAGLSSFLLQDSKNFPLSFDSDSVVSVNNLGNKILILTTENFCIYSKRGKLLLDKPHAYQTPAVSLNGEKAVVFDRGGKGFCLVNSKEITYEGNAQYPILCAEYGASGNYALGTRGEKSTSQLTVYSVTNKVEFQWNSAYEHITSITLNDNGKFCGVSVVGAENGEMFTVVNYFGFDYSEALNSQKIADCTAFDIEFTATNHLTLFADNGVYTVNKNGDKYEKVIEYYSSEFNSFQKCSDGKYVVSLAKYGSENDFSLTVFNQKGKVKSEIQINENIKNISVSDKYIFALAENKILVYNLNGRKMTDIDIVGDVYSIHPTDNYIFIYSLDKISRCFTFGNSEIELSI